jgi:hypothetical protein
VPDDVAERVSDVLRRLGLRMGVIDLKLTPDGEPVWLEVNPQGQFLFLEPLLNEPLAEHFTDFLLSAGQGGTPQRPLTSARIDPSTSTSLFGSSVAHFADHRHS